MHFIIPASMMPALKACAAAIAVFAAFRLVFTVKTIGTPEEQKHAGFTVMSCTTITTLVISAFVIGAMGYIPDNETYPYEIPNTILHLGKDLPEGFEKKALETYNLIPKKQRTMLESSGFSIYIAGESEDVSKHGYRSGFYFPFGDYACVQTGGRYNRWFVRTLLHEAGHRIDYSYGIIDMSQDPEWKELCNMYRESGNDFYTLQSKLTEGDNEAFAECFSFSCYCPDSFSGMCPDLYEYIIRRLF